MTMKPHDKYHLEMDDRDLWPSQEIYQRYPYKREHKLIRSYSQFGGGNYIGERDTTSFVACGKYNPKYSVKRERIKMVTCKHCLQYIRLYLS
jgi:hypothetical protein